MGGPQHSCPPHWRPKCYPRDCPPPTIKIPPQTQPPSTHNVIYLVDEHNMSNRKDTPKHNVVPQRRYAWHHSVANLQTFNMGEKPDTITLHDFIANPQVNNRFRWDGYMFDIPGGEATCRVAIALGAADASNESLSGPVKKDESPVDRVVGFAGTYIKPEIPLGPLVSVRRDDSYRALNTFTSADGKEKVAWHCAYYITKEIPTKTSAGFSGFFNAAAEEDSPDEAPGDEQGEATVDYNAMMDNSIEDDVPITNSSGSWGGNVFGFTIADDVPAGNDQDGAEFGGNVS